MIGYFRAGFCPDPMEGHVPQAVLEFVIRAGLFYGDKSIVAYLKEKEREEANAAKREKGKNKTP